MRGVRGRLLLTVVGLVALTSIVLGVGASAYVAASLRAQQLEDALAQANFTVAVLADELLPPDVGPDDPAVATFLDAVDLRGGVGTAIDFGDEDPVVSGLVAAAFGTISPELRTIVARGEVGYERLEFGGVPYLVTGARRPPTGPDIYFFTDTSATEAAIDQLSQALVVGAVLLIVLAAIAARAVVQGLLQPVRQAGVAAETIADGDLSARLDVASGDEFGAWAASFNRMASSLERTVADLQRAQRSQRAFVADVSHELRTPVTALVHEAALLRDHLDGLPADARRAGQLLVGDIARLRVLVDDLMEISRFDAAAEAVEAVETDLQLFVRTLVAARAPHARIIASDGPPRVLLDRRRLERILGNLLDNAREHGDDASVEVRLDVIPDGGDEWVEIVVADRGPGVAPDQLASLFERFHKADPSRTRGGSGLGLAIAREHARLLGGDLTAGLRPGGGMRFTVRIPVTRPLPAGDEPVTVARDA
jgi:signal transduction histidine kinase